MTNHVTKPGDPGHDARKADAQRRVVEHKPLLEARMRAREQVQVKDKTKEKEAQR